MTDSGRLRLRRKWKAILCDLDPREVCDILYEQRVLNGTDLEIIYDESRLRKHRCRHLLVKVFLDKNAQTIEKFFESLNRQNYQHLCAVTVQESSNAGDKCNALNEEEMAEVSLSLSSVWQDVGILAGGLSLRDVDDIEKCSEQMRPMKMLLKWRANAADQKPHVGLLTKEELNSVLHDIDADDDV